MKKLGMTFAPPLYDERRRQRVECSCGRPTFLEFDGTKFVPDNPLWKFRKTDEKGEGGRRLAYGWYCGETGHEQKTEGSLTQ